MPRPAAGASNNEAPFPSMRPIKNFPWCALAVFHDTTYHTFLSQEFQAARRFLPCCASGRGFFPFFQPIIDFSRRIKTIQTILSFAASTPSTMFCAPFNKALKSLLQAS
jgi:hypothetical protein